MKDNIEELSRELRTKGEPELAKKLGDVLAQEDQDQDINKKLETQTSYIWDLQKQAKEDRDKVSNYCKEIVQLFESRVSATFDEILDAEDSLDYQKRTLKENPEDSSYRTQVEKEIKSMYKRLRFHEDRMAKVINGLENILQ